MFAPFESFDNSARIWIYQSGRKFTEAEKSTISETLTAFTHSWVVHGNPLKTSCTILLDQFIVLAADETFNEASGCSIDSSVLLNSVPIKASINPILTVFEKYSKQVIINPYRYNLSLKSVSLSTNQYLTVTPVAGLELTNFTVCVWFKKNSSSGVYEIAGYFPKSAHQDGRGWSLESNASNDRVIWGDADGTWAVINGTAPNSAWKFMMFTFSGTVGELFTDNTLRGNVADGINYTNGGGTNPDQKYFTIGSIYNAAFTNFFNGLITGFAIFIKVLDSTERAWIYNSGKVRDYRAASFFSSNCKMYLPFNDTFN